MSSGKKDLVSRYSVGTPALGSTNTTAHQHNSHEPAGEPNGGATARSPCDSVYSQHAATRCGYRAGNGVPAVLSMLCCCVGGHPTSSRAWNSVVQNFTSCRDVIMEAAQLYADEQDEGKVRTCTAGGVAAVAVPWGCALGLPHGAPASGRLHNPESTFCCCLCCMCSFNSSAANLSS